VVKSFAVGFATVAAPRQAAGRMEMKRLVLDISRLAAVLAVSATLIIGCSEGDLRDKSTVTLPDSTVMPDQITSNARIYLYSGGHKTTDLRADELNQYTKLDSTLATNIEAEFFDSAGAVISTLAADSGYIRERDNFLAVSGSVVVVGEDSVRVETEYLEWDADAELVETDSFVTVIKNNDTLTSIGMVTDPRLRDITFKKQVSGSLTDVEKMKNEKK
jgi:LPS export ABC transporter protein LptC